MKQLKSHVRHDNPEIMSISHIHVLLLSSAISIIVSPTLSSWFSILVLLSAFNQSASSLGSGWQVPNWILSGGGEEGGFVRCAVHRSVSKEQISNRISARCPSMPLHSASNSLSHDTARKLVLFHLAEIKRTGILSFLPWGNPLTLQYLSYECVIFDTRQCFTHSCNTQWMAVASGFAITDHRMTSKSYFRRCPVYRNPRAGVEWWPWVSGQALRSHKRPSTVRQMLWRDTAEPSQNAQPPERISQPRSQGLLAGGEKPRERGWG